MRPFLALSAILFASALPLRVHAQSVEATPAQAAKLYDSLARTINRGADIFNDEADYAGCYRLFEGALISIKPFASPERQKEIDEALQKSARMARFEDKAYRLRGALDLVREEFRRISAVKPATSTKDETKSKLPLDLKSEEKKPATETKSEKPSVDKKVIDVPKTKPIPPPEKLKLETKSSQAEPEAKRFHVLFLEPRLLRFCLPRSGTRFV